MSLLAALHLDTDKNKEVQKVLDMYNLLDYEQKKAFSSQLQTIPPPSDKFINAYIPYISYTYKTETYNVFENFEDIKKAIIYVVKDEGNFTTWEDSRYSSDSMFNDKMADYLESNSKPVISTKDPKEVSQWMEEKHQNKIHNFYNLIPNLTFSDDDIILE
jgi:hypothetical protein